MRIPIDHLVLATTDLQRGMNEVERFLGISPAVGGAHPGRGTRNALVALGTESYLEILAPDPRQPRPATGRWLGVDTVSASRLTAWAAKATDLPDVRARALAQGIAIGDVRSGSRRRPPPQNDVLSWQLTDPEARVADGAVPFFIDWGASPHPAATAPRGATLVDFRIEHPEASKLQRMLDALDLGVTVVRADIPALVASIEGAHGLVEVR